MNLPAPESQEWIPNWPVAPRRLRCIDPELARSWSALTQEAMHEARQLLRSDEVLQSVDANAVALLTALQQWQRSGLVNAAPRSATLNAAVVGAAIGRAAMGSGRADGESIHPVWHLTLYIAEQQVEEDAGLQGIMALNAAFRGWTTGTAWAENLEKQP